MISDKTWTGVRIIAGLALSFALAFALPRVSFIGAVDSWLGDFRLAQFSTPRPQDSRVMVVTVTEQTLAQFPYRSPLNRGFLADLIVHIAVGGPKAIGVDYLFDQATQEDLDHRLKIVFGGDAAPVVVGEAGPQTPMTGAQRKYQSDFLGGLRGGLVNLQTDQDGIVRRTFPGKCLGLDEGLINRQGLA